MRHAAVILLLTICIGLSAQVYQLPDIEVDVESPIKAYIYKKPLVFDPDSLKQDHFPAFLPEVKPALDQGRTLLYYPPVKYHAWLNLSSRANIRTTFDYYPSDLSLKNIGLDIDKFTRKDNRRATNLTLSSLFVIDKHMLSLAANFADNAFEDFDQDMLNLRLDHQTDSLTCKNITLRKVQSAIELTRLDENSDIIDNSYTLAGFEHKSLPSISGSDFKVHLVTDRRATALELGYYLPYQLPLLDEISLGVLTDFSHVVPAYAMSYHANPGQNSSLTITQSPYAESVTLLPLADFRRWCEIGDQHRITLVPWNWDVHYRRIVQTKELPDPMELIFSYSSQFSLQHPIILPGVHPTLPKVSHQDILINTISAHAISFYKDFEFDQSVTLSLQHLSERSWRRNPYESLFNIRTVASRNYGKTNLSIILDQDYNRVDHNYRHLPESFDLSAKATYRINNNWQAIAELNNFFNTDNTLYRGLPSQRREFWLGIRYLGL